MAQAVIYARVSSKEQADEGFSIPAQLKLLRECAVEEGFDVGRELVDVETAKRAGRQAFSEMVDFLQRRRKTCRVLLVEKTDRLYRNLRDYVTLDELDLEVHFVKESFILSDESWSTEKFMHGIKVLMAEQYVENLGEEASKGMREKAEQECLCDDLRRMVWLGVEVALMRLSEARELASRYETDILPRTESVTRTIEVGFRAGASTIMDVLDAQRTLRTVETESRGAVAEHLKAQAALGRATGGPVRPLSGQGPTPGQPTTTD